MKTVQDRDRISVCANNGWLKVRRIEMVRVGLGKRHRVEGELTWQPLNAVQNTVHTAHFSMQCKTLPRCSENCSGECNIQCKVHCKLNLHCEHSSAIRGALPSAMGIVNYCWLSNAQCIAHVQHNFSIKCTAKCQH